MRRGVLEPSCSRLWTIPVRQSPLSGGMFAPQGANWGVVSLLLGPRPTCSLKPVRPPHTLLQHPPCGEGSARRQACAGGVRRGLCHQPSCSPPHTTHRVSPWTSTPLSPPRNFGEGTQREARGEAMIEAKPEGVGSGPRALPSTLLSGRFRQSVRRSGGVWSTGTAINATLKPSPRRGGVHSRAPPSTPRSSLLCEQLGSTHRHRHPRERVANRDTGPSVPTEPLAPRRLKRTSPSKASSPSDALKRVGGAV